MKRFLAKYSPLFILAGLCAILALSEEYFADPANLKTVAYRSCDVALIALGETLVILAAGIDLSVGSVASLAGVVSTLLIVKWGMPALVAIVGGVAVGLLCGLASGLLWTKGKLPPFIATLAVMMVARGLAHVITRSEAIPVIGMENGFDYLGGTHGGLTGWWVPVLITLAIGIALSVSMTFSRFGRALYATGGNATGARLSGIPVDRIRILAFAICGLLSGLGGVMIASRVGLGDPQSAQGMELDAIAACVIGGASLMGGEGNCLCTLAGVVIMKVLVNFCNLKGIDPYLQMVFVGTLILFLVFYDTWRKRRAGIIRD